MHASMKGSVDAASFASLWGPRLVRFFFLLSVSQGAAETLTLETLSELLRSRAFSSSALVRLAASKANSLPVVSEQEHDPIARAVASLPRRQGCVIALSRGMGLTIDQIAEAMRISVAEAKRVFTDGLLQLHQLLATSKQRLESARES